MADIHQLPSHSELFFKRRVNRITHWPRSVDCGATTTTFCCMGWPTRKSGRRRDFTPTTMAQRAVNPTRHRSQIFLLILGLSVRVGTFNVNGQDPKESLRPWLCPPDTTTATSDLIVLGFQELDLSTEALLISTTTLREDIWCEALMRDLAELGEEYVKLTSKQLVGVLIVVLIRRPILPLLAPSGVASSSAGVGILGTMGNKGGVALRLQLLDTTLVFMNAHLAASAHAVPPPDPNQTQPVFIGRGPIPMDAVVDRRNADYISLTGELFENSSAIEPKGDSRTRREGDFNYRIDLLDDEIRAFIEDPTDKDYTTLLKFDQKDITGTPSGFAWIFCWLSLNHVCRRRPAWTDRILYQTARGKDKTVRLVEDSYQSYPAISLSDHKPVSADFIVQVCGNIPSQPAFITGKQVEEMDRGLAETRMKQLIKNLGRLPLEEDVPRIRLSDDFIDFVGVRYLKPLIQELKIQNIGFITAYWRIIPLENDPDWVTIHPTSGVLLPGDSVAITITTSITNGIAAELNAGNKKLEDIVILRTIRGKDTFLPINGTWSESAARTCLAYSPTALVRLPGPVRTSTVLKSAQLPPEKASSSPRELMRLINWLMKNSIEFVSMMYVALDTGAEFPFDEKTPDHGVALAFASALLLFLEEMPEPVIPYGLYAQCALTSSREQAYEILDTLPGLNANVRTSIMFKGDHTHAICLDVDFNHCIPSLLLSTRQESEKHRRYAKNRIFAEVLWFDSMTMPLANRLSPLTRVGGTPAKVNDLPSAHICPALLGPFPS
ncbi:endonuclease/Exonuclease/phosphatase family domain-containing protein [Rhizoctonia solani AG-1 IA]|uniref:Endonuclease/Exonuclease/phosphatase family domain-containing protein n=1 Tax=Thanatephorus cucumeris (strain AG1-IA) TaxID=983506 RepID=L8WS29_THACA|nr:endonuclease/Exonuclease/phosphatase family domain-containing protein [Rhizoctonia solani AG-1 IA]